MIFKVENFSIVLLILSSITTTVFGQCRINLPINPLATPRFYKQFGSHEILISTADNLIYFNNNEAINAYCDTKFENSNYSGKRKLNLTCSGSYIYVDGNYYGNSYIQLECALLKWNLYETTKSFSWCPSSTVSYILARPTDDAVSYQKAAGICCNTDNVSIYSVYYTSAPRFSRNLGPIALDNYTPGAEMKYVKETFTTKSITTDLYDNQQFKDLLQISNYQYNSTIQNSRLHDETFVELGSLLDFVWWPNLRLGNWKYYEDAFASHVETTSQAYDVLTGTSEVVKVPIKENCQNNLTLKEFTDKTDHKIPLYVWHYIKPYHMDNSSDEVVIIGFNSPFYEFYSEKYVVFCNDICNEIEWLKNVRHSFRHVSLGVVFCCRAGDVKSSKRLNGFPEYMGKPLPSTAPPFPTLTLLDHYPEDDIDELDEY